MSRYLIAAVVVLAAAGGGFYFYTSMQMPESLTKAEPAVAPATPESAAAENEAAPTTAKKTIPATLPDITLANAANVPTKLASFGGRPLMVNFWATWCAPCRREIPLLNKIREQRKSQNAEIVGIAVDFREDVLKFVQNVPLSYPFLIGEEDGLAAAEAFGMGMAFPFSVFVDSKNRILTIKIGELHEDEANFAFDRLRDIDNGILTLEQAQSEVSDAFREMSVARAQAEAEPASKSAK